MNPTDKLLGKMSKKDKARLLKVMLLIQNGDLSGIKLKGPTNSYRVRVGVYRILYKKKGDGILIEEIRRRNENTYK